MSDITFSKEEKAQIIQKVQKYFNEELDQEICSFDADFLIDFFAREVGANFYNQGLYDAQQLLTEKVEEIEYLVQDLEKPINYSK